MTLQTPEKMAALLGPDLKTVWQIQWFVRLAVACRMDLLILQRVESGEQRIEEISFDEPLNREAKGPVQELMTLIKDSPELRAGAREGGGMNPVETIQGAHVVHVQFKQIHYTDLVSLRQLVLNELGASRIALFSLARSNLLDMKDVDLVKERRLFMRYLPCKVLLCQGIKQEKGLSRILVAATNGQDGKEALQFSLDLAARDKATLTALHVNPDVGMVAQQVGEQRLDLFLKKMCGSREKNIARRVVVDDQIHNGVRRVWEEGSHDLIVIGVPRFQVEGGMSTKLGKDIPLVMVIPASPIASTFKKFVEEGIQRIVPQIQREGRIALVDRVQSSAAWNFDFVTLMVLSTIMAAIGLVQNSAAVVIGAMLVAPLMTPLLGMGLALVQGNPVLARLSVRSVVLGLCVSLLGGFLVGLAILNFEEPTREMLARGGPGLLDLFVAFAAGLAAAYAYSRPGLIAALPGVAIAAALVPPIATSGLALSLGDFRLAMGALLLFGINMVTIILASMTSLWIVGIRSFTKSSRWIRVAGTTIMVSVLALGIFLSFHPRANELTGALPPGLVETIQKRLGTDYQFNNLSVAYDELGVQLHLSISGKAPVPEDLATDIRTAASDHYDQPVRVRLLARIEINANPAE